MVIVFDMDNTLADEMGAGLRPGIVDFLQKLKSEKHELKLWTNSKRERAISILQEHKLKAYFTECIYREDYDPDDKGIRKDIRRVKGDFLIDDDPKEIQFVKSIGKDGFLITSFRKGGKVKAGELDEIYKVIKSKSAFIKNFF
ncbi:MAG: DUF705 domain-containing protein [Leptospiraceae bacterium]|nr:DUF705 domain-containing protein [Leptospiraceae bacterium]MBK9498741.1 DUF705 domain-containing protein [Leptospiraceae bacterium]MBL0262609.1 DUF705 domain-containing protein [Leptospiraceae bacterium]MBP9163275.1 DUF705 domain-containing protein [Leptospiraceae bacterium]